MPDPKRIFVHIGAPKTGTTYLQKVLFRNRQALKQVGVLYPRLGMDAHHTATWALRGKADAGVDPARYEGDWKRLIDKTNRWTEHTVVISSEMFVFLDRERAAEVLTAFGDAEVHVIYTARDLMRQVPAVWQEQVKNQRTESYRGYVSDLLGVRRHQMARHFWRAQDAGRALRRWSHAIPPQHVHVVTAPPPGSAPDLLWRRFAEVIGIDPGAYDADIPPVNTSLSVTSAEVLRRYNLSRGGELPLLQYRRQVLQPLMPALLDAVPDARKLPLSRRQQRGIVKRAQRIAAAIRDAGYDVVGELDDLVPAMPDKDVPRRPGATPDDVRDTEVVDALMDVVDHLLAQQRRTRKKYRRVQRRLRKSRRAEDTDGSRSKRVESAS